MSTMNDNPTTEELAQRLTEWRDYDFAPGEVPYEDLTEAIDGLLELEAENNWLALQVTRLCNERDELQAELNKQKGTEGQ